MVNINVPAGVGAPPLDTTTVKQVCAAVYVYPPTRGSKITCCMSMLMQQVILDPHSRVQFIVKTEACEFINTILLNSDMHIVVGMYLAVLSISI